MFAVVKRTRAPGAEIGDVDVPEISRNEALVKVEAASICGTDIHIWSWNTWAQNRIQKLPLIFGHEFSGEVVEVGDEVSQIRVGDKVSAETHIVDGTCYQCLTDRMHVCENLQILGVDRDGVFAEYVAIPERNAWKNDPKLDPIITSIQEPLGNAVHTILPKGNVDVVGKNVAVLGCGPIGLMAIAILKTLGAAKIIATAGGRNEIRMELARNLGADAVLNVQDTHVDVVKTVFEITGGKGMDVVLEMSGAPSALKQAFEMLTPGGRVSLLGLFNRNVEIDFNDAIVFKSASVYGISGRRMFQTWYQTRGLLAIREFQEKIASIITHQISMHDIEKAVNIIRSKKAGKVVLKPR